MSFLSSIPLGKNSLTIIALFMVLVAIPMTVYLAGQQQEIRQRANVGEGCDVDNWTFNPPFPAPGQRFQVSVHKVFSNRGWDHSGFARMWDGGNLSCATESGDNITADIIAPNSLGSHNIEFRVENIQCGRPEEEPSASTCSRTSFTVRNPESTPTPTPGGGSTSLDLSIKNQLVTNPRNNSRTVEVKIFNTQNQEVRSDIVNATFQMATGGGTFRGTLNLGAFTTGTYVVKLKVRNTLRRLVENLTNITAGQVNTLRETELFSGDIVEDNELNALDYSNLVGCLDRNRGTPRYNCQSTQIADLNDDGAVDGQDLNILVFNFSHRRGD